MNMQPANRGEIAELVESLCQDNLAPSQVDRLNVLLCTDKQARQYYIRYLRLHASLPMFSGAKSGKQDPAQLQQHLGAMDHDITLVGEEGYPGSFMPKEGEGAPSGVLGFLGDCFQQGASFLSKPGIFSLLVAVGLPGIILLVLVMSLIQQIPMDQPYPVATVVRTHDCLGCLGDGQTWLLSGTDLIAGERLTLRKGLAEIEFADGAKVIIEAPTAFEIRHANGGFLQMGRLAATVPNTAHGFTVETPLATVVDLGTDFGVLVAADGTAEAHVFTGEIEIATKTMPENPTSLTKRYRVGQAARIQMPNNLQAATSIENISAVADEFVRSFPAGLPKDALPRNGNSKTNKRLIASVDRHGGAKGSRVPIGSFEDETDPLESNESGLQLKAPLFSDRVYIIDDMSPELAGADYVRTFLSDKFHIKDGYQYHNYGYDVSFTPDRDRVYLMILVDDRFERGGGEQQAAVDQIVSKFASPGEFVDTGFHVDVTDASTPHPLSAYGKWVPTKDQHGNPIIYTFRAAPSGRSTYVITAMPNAPGTSNNINQTKP